MRFPFSSYRYTGTRDRPLRRSLCGVLPWLSLLLLLGCGERKTPDEVVEEMVRTYREAKSFADESAEEIVIRTPGTPQQIRMDHRFSYEAPARFFYDTRVNGQPIQEIASDGKELRGLSPEQGAVLVTSAPSALQGTASALERLGFGERAHPLSFLAGSDPLAGSKATFEEGESLNGRSMHVVELRAANGVETSLWIGKQDHLLYRTRQRIPPAQSRFGVEVESTETHRDLRLNQAPGGDRFTVSTPAGFRSVEIAVVGGPAPVGEFRDLRAGKIDLAALRGKVVVLNFWAFWCGPCRMEMPALQKLVDEMGPKRVVVLGIVSPDARYPDWKEKSIELVKEAGLSYSTIVDQNGRLAEAYGVEGLPHSAIIDREGRVSASFSGLRDESEIREAVKKAGA